MSITSRQAARRSEDPDVFEFRRQFSLVSRERLVLYAVAAGLWVGGALLPEVPKILLWVLAGITSVFIIWVTLFAVLGARLWRALEPESKSDIIRRRQELGTARRRRRGRRPRPAGR